jgi:hypothetical protein
MTYLNREISRAYDGYITKYRISRRPEEHEDLARLDIKKNLGMVARDRGLLKVNSVFMEYVDRHFFSKGWAAMNGLPACIVLLYFGLLFSMAANEPLASGKMPSQGMIVAIWVWTFILVMVCSWIVCFMLAKDFFRYTHYPIRFNRQSRKVYVFKYGGESGVLEFNWEDGYWFVGCAEGRVYDLRCHILDSEGVIRHTVSIAAACDTKTEVLQHWEMVRRYMEEPLSTLPFPPLRLFMATEPTWRNSFIIQVGTFGGISKYMWFSVTWAFFRWISQRTCRAPRWPASVEAACQIPPDDPYQMPEPVVAGEPIVRDTASVQREKEYQDLVIAEVVALEGISPGSKIRN